MPLGGGTLKPELKYTLRSPRTHHSGTVNRWTAITLPHLVAQIFPLSLKFALISVQITRHDPTPHCRTV